MVRSREENAGYERIPVSWEGNEKDYGACACSHSPHPGALALNMNRKNSPTSALTALNEKVCSPTENTEQASTSQKGTKAQKKKTDQSYLGVRVRMPVKDMLRDIRIAKGMDPKEMQKKENKGSKAKCLSGSPQEIYFSTKVDWWGSPHKTGSLSYSYSVQEQWNSMTHSWTQLDRETRVLKSISNQELLLQDEKGRLFLHRAVDEGKRSFVYVVARRMADLNKLDSKDAEGKTSLHLAAQKNQHLMVADLISFGANINERDKYGKTCLHLSAENGHIRVLEVLKSCMKSGIYIDVEAQDVNGLSALQLASVALKSIVGDLETSVTVSQARVHSMRKEQMMETLKCLLQMECNLQCLVRLAVG
ncbi:hypothetical protein QTP86_014506 [Hemibagrus guttatus]|nr:hypothetical protein QTP86_014506 [Hemibagrus guttatus]